MKVTKEFLHEKSACAEGLRFVTKNKLVGLEDVDFLNKLIELDKLEWANWLIVRVMERKQYLAYAIFAAEQVIEIFEKRCPNDLRPRKAVDAARKVLENDTQKNCAAAYDAYVAANDAYYDAYAAYITAYNDADVAYNATNAAYAAYAAAYVAYNDADVAYNAADAAYAAYAAAYDAANAADAAYDANNDAARNEMRLKILQYGISLIQRA